MPLRLNETWGYDDTAGWVFDYTTNNIDGNSSILRHAAPWWAVLDKASETASPGRYSVRLDEPVFAQADMLALSPFAGLHRYTFEVNFTFSFSIITRDTSFILLTPFSNCHSLRRTWITRYRLLSLTCVMRPRATCLTSWREILSVEWPTLLSWRTDSLLWHRSRHRVPSMSNVTI